MEKKVLDSIKEMMFIYEFEYGEDSERLFGYKDAMHDILELMGEDGRKITRGHRYD